MKLLQHIIFWLLLVAAGGPVLAQPSSRVSPGQIVTVCEAASANTPIPTFTEDSCQEITAFEINPHDKLIWVKAAIELPPEMVNQNMPLGLVILAKAASAAYFNGHYLGHNGSPGTTANTEQAGSMDATFVLPKEALRVGTNDIVLLMSAHHSYIELASPIHHIGVSPYNNPTDWILRGYLPSLLPLGALIVGALYFGVLALRRRERGRMLLVPLVAIFASAQLISEISRGLFAYSYPFHDIRLTLILLFALASGFCLLLHVCDRFLTKYTTATALIGFGLTLAAVIFMPGFDFKSLIALAMPALLGALIAANAVRDHAKNALGYAIVLFLFVLIPFVTPEDFLDIYYYYIVAGLLLFLFAQQIQFAIAERELRAKEQARADRLQIILDESHERQNPSSLKVNQHGKIELVPTDTICFAKGARDYVELITNSGASLLHNGSLNDLEEELPSNFLRVHRSYIVNTAFIQTLVREPSGKGNLLLTTGTSVPVSRRIMPSVRKALA
jgi:hypothetical protein